MSGIFAFGGACTGFFSFAEFTIRWFFIRLLEILEMRVKDNFIHFGHKLRDNLCMYKVKLEIFLSVKYTP